jgi:hypothetical protein
METEKTPLDFRREEVAAYDKNIALYKSIAATLPGEWPDRLIAYKGAKNQHELIAEIQDLDDVELVSKLWAHDAATNSIRAEMVEKAKAEAILRVLEAQQAK